MCYVHRSLVVMGLVCSSLAYGATTLQVGKQFVSVELANTPESLMQGLMWRKSLSKRSGMFFVFEAEHIQCMWMRNTLIPLSVAFIDAQGEIVNIEDMAPQTDTPHCAIRPVRYALEVNQGWFKRKKIKIGDRVLLSPQIAPINP